MKNTKDVIPKNLLMPEDEGDLDGFEPSPPSHRIDDKAATLEDELQDLKLRFNRERFMYVFIMVVLFVCLVGPNLTNGVLGFLITAALIFTISVGKYFDFPWAVVPLERWHDLWYRYCERKMLGKGEERPNEPFNGQDDPPT